MAAALRRPAGAPSHSVAASEGLLEVMRLVSHRRRSSQSAL